MRAGMARLSVGGLTLALLVPACGPAPAPPAIRGLRVDEVLRGEASGFPRITAPRALAFPADHGPHAAYRTEWWYFTGNLDADGDGRRLGFQLTFFRRALAADPPDRSSPWASSQVYFAHLALTDVESGRLHAFERFSRAALDLAGASANPFSVHVEDWSARSTGEGMLPLRLRARQEGFGLDLLAAPGKPLVLHGESGFSRKSGEAGNASHYYSFPRLPVTGSVALGDRDVPVRGEAWFDHEWSTSALADHQEGWDWFALQLDDGSELMLYRMRRLDGSMDPYSSGTLVQQDGEAIPLTADDFHVEVREHWSSADRRARYPVAFSLEVPAHDLQLRVDTPVPAQEIDLTLRYWEGLVDVTGTRGEAPVRGRGYLEMTGYAR